MNDMINKNLVVFSDEFQNEIRLSSISSWEGNIGFNGLAAKFVLSGNETYFIGKNKYKLSNNQYIIGNSSTQSIVEINSDIPVWGLCIDISESVLNEVLKYHINNYQGFIEFLTTDKILVNKYNFDYSKLGKLIRTIHYQMNSEADVSPLFQKELFYKLAEQIIFDQKEVFEYYEKLKFKKQETNQELFKKLFESKNWLAKHFTNEMDVEKISSEFCISQYHFIRLFKSLFNITPYQYMLQQRLNHCKSLILQGQSIADKSINYGFSDLPSFSKAFKKQFGIPPSKLLKN